MYKSSVVPEKEVWTIIHRTLKIIGKNLKLRGDFRGGPMQTS